MRTIGLHGDFGLDTFLSDSIFSVVEFAWGGCWSFGPTLDELEGKYKQVKFVQVPIESDADLTYITSQYSARDVPAVVLFKGKLNVGVFPQGNLDEIVGAMQKHGFPTGEKPENKLQDKSYLSVSLTNRALENMWNSRALDDANSAVLPPPGHMDDITSQLRVTLLSKTQRKAMKADEVSQLVEPTVALYCPIEGGEHIIDTTIKELAARTNSEVQMIDMAQLAAGEWGAFGTSASGFRFKKNPLGKVKPGEDLDDNDDGESNVQALESFWQKVIDSNPVPATQPAPGHDATGDLTSTSTTPRRRIIYIRDFGLLAPRVSTWFPPLYTAIRARRTGGLGPESQITHPTTVVFGVCPPVSSILPNSAKRELCYEGCDCDSCCPPLKEWDESAVKERTERFKKTKAKLEKGEILEDLPSFRPKIKINQSRVKGVERGEKMTRADSSGVEAKDPAEDLEIEEDGATMSESQAPESNPTNETGQAEDDSSTSDSDDSEVTSKSASSATSEPSDEDYTQRLDGYFRSYVVAPAKRNLKLERASRENRRRELSELMLRMVTGVKGGLIEPGAVRLLAREKETGEAEADNGDIQDGMVKEWDEHLAKPDDFKGVVDRALEIAMLSCEDGDDGEDEEQKPVLVSWAQIREAWRANKRSSDERKTWMKCDEEAVVGDEKPPVDEIVEKVKAEDLDEYEQRLTGCIVDVAKLSTTFHSVHLPTHVIDSVRSIVSLPLLFPQSFQSGILKEQAISGALLFGPPGTGKTLLVRALAKESGSRMLAIKPSDIADKWVGETEKLVRSLFSLARRLKPCVVFIDEIDSIMGSRTSSSCDGGSRWHTSMLTEFMQEMDGLMASSVIVIGATNRPFDVDDAVLRRLPYRLLVDLPGIEAREEILKIMLRNDALAPDVDIRKIAQQTERLSGSDLKNLCVSAAMDALKENVKLPWITTGRNTNSLYAKPESASGSKSTSSTTGTPENSIAIPKPSDDENSCDPSNPESKTPSSPSTSEVAPDKSSGVSKPHILAARHFSRALMDIAPSSSESQNSLSELRKWNTQFGMGTRDQSRFASALPYAYGGINSSTSNSVNLPGANGISSYNPVGLTPGRYAGGLGSLGSSEAVLSGLGTPGAGSVGLNSNSVNALGSNIVGGPGSSRLGALGTNSVNGANGFTSNSQGGQALLTRPPSDIKDALNSHAAKFPGRNQHVALYTPGSTTGNLSET